MSRERVSRGYEPKTLEIGACGARISILLGVDGKRYSLADFADKPVLVVIFTTNHCPDAIASYSRMRQMVDDYRDECRFCRDQWK